MADKRTVTIKSVDSKVWNKPGTDQHWYSVVIVEYPSEPIKFVQNKDKGAPQPEVGRSYEGTVYVNDGKTSFYPFAEKKQATGVQGKPRGQVYDDYTMYLSYAKDVAIAMIEHSYAEFEGREYDSVLTQILEGADKLYSHHKEPAKEVIAPVPPAPEPEIIPF